MTSPGPAAADPLAIAFVIARYPPALGGSEAQAEALAGQLRRAGNRVTVLTQRLPGGAVPAQSDVLRLSPSVGGRAASARFGLRLVPALLRLRPQVIQAFLLSSPALFGALAARRIGCPLVIKLGGSGRFGDLSSSRRRWISRRRLGLVLRTADRIVAPSRAAREELLAAGFPAGRSSVIPNGVDLSRFRPASAQGDSSAGDTVLFAGRLEEEKDLDTLLRAWASVRASRPRGRLAILGEGSRRGRLEDLVRELGVAATVSFAGAVPREGMPGWYGRASILVLPSRSEGISNTLLEAMASGLAPVVSDIPGNREVFPTGEGALLFPFGDAGSLAGCLGRLLDDPVLRSGIAHAAAARSAAFSIERTAGMYLDLYRRLLAERAGA